MSLQQLEVVAIGGAVAAVALLLWKASKVAGQAVGAVGGAAGGALTGDNALTHGATNASGEPTSAYQGAGVLGTAGAATNAVSGGAFASFGEWLGGAVFEATHADPMATPPAPASSGGATGSWDEIDTGDETARLLARYPAPSYSTGSWEPWQSGIFGWGG